MSRITIVLMLGALVLVQPCVAGDDPAPPGVTSHLTNMAMLTDAARASVSEMFMTFSIPQGSSVLLESESPHEAKWFVENLILGQLTERGYFVTLKPDEKVEEDPKNTEELSGAGADMGQDSADSLAQGGESAAAEEASPPGLFTDTLEMEIDVDYVLRFRVAECGLIYPRAFRKSPFGTKLVQRFAFVSVFGTLVKGDRESVVWVGRGDAERLDHVPSGKLALLEGKTFPFTHPQVESRGMGAYAEPALVLGIVLGLVYLFYTNQ